MLRAAQAKPERGDKKSVPYGTLFFHMKNYLLQLDLAADFLDLLLQSLGILLGQTPPPGGGGPPPRQPSPRPDPHPTPRGPG